MKSKISFLTDKGSLIATVMLFSNEGEVVASNKFDVSGDYSEKTLRSLQYQQLDEYLNSLKTTERISEQDNENSEVIQRLSIFTEPIDL